MSDKCPDALPGLINTLIVALQSTKGESGLVLCRCLVSLGELRSEELFRGHLPLLQQLYTDALSQEESWADGVSEKIKHNQLIGLAVLLLLADRTGRSCKSVGRSIHQLIMTSPWPAYLIAHQATRLVGIKGTK